jgi:hypothetical protein
MLIRFILFIANSDFINIYFYNFSMIQTNLSCTKKNENDIKSKFIKK